jgi:hypothetical protein
VASAPTAFGVTVVSNSCSTEADISRTAFAI